MCLLAVSVLQYLKITICRDTFNKHQTFCTNSEKAIVVEVINDNKNKTSVTCAIKNLQLSDFKRLQG